MFVAPSTPSYGLLSQPQATPIVFNEQSLGMLNQVNPTLQELMLETERRAQAAGIEFEISEGLRDQERQAQMVAEGRSQTMNSRHLGGNAVDINVRDQNGNVTWEHEPYAQVSEIAKQVASEMGIPDFVWGGDWRTLVDAVHFQVGGGGAPSHPRWGGDVVSTSNPTGQDPNPNLPAAPLDPIQTNVLNDDGTVGPALNQALVSSDTVRTLGGTPQYDVYNGRTTPVLTDPNYDSMAGLQPVTGPTATASGGGLPSGAVPPVAAAAAQAQEQANQQGDGQMTDNRSDGLGGLLGLGRPGVLTDDRQEMLLALGTGLLSGSNWQEGLANAGNLALGVTQNRRENARQDAAALQEQQFALDRIDRQGQVSAQAQEAQAPQLLQGNFQMRDGSILGNLSTLNGRIFDASNRDVTDQVVQRVNNSDSFGSRGQLTAGQAFDVQGQIRASETSLRTIDRVLAATETMSSGLAGGIADVNLTFKTIFGQQVNPDEMLRAITRGDTQALVGQIREQIVGPGVMTEQDAIRIINAIGGDISIWTNPQVLAERLRLIREETQRGYDGIWNQYNTTRTAYPQNNLIEIPYYSPTVPNGAPLDPSNGTSSPVLSQGAGALANESEIEAILQSQGL